MMYTGMTPPRVPFTKTGGGTAVSLAMLTVCLCFRVKAQPSQEQKGIRDLTFTVPAARSLCIPWHQERTAGRSGQNPPLIEPLTACMRLALRGPLSHVSIRD